MRSLVGTAASTLPPFARRALLAVTLLFALPPALVAQATSGTQGTITGVVRGEGNAPLAGVQVSLVGTQVGAITQADGRYRIRTAPGTYELRARLIGYALGRATATVAAGQTATADIALERATTSLQAVAVTGTRGEARTVLDAPAPIDVLTATDIRAMGRVETAQIIQALAPSFNFPRPTVSDGSDHVRPATLRGLGPDQVLVLVNGKRRYNSALVNVNGSIGRGSTAVDLNAIPAAMIERIEILRDGAAAQYGSDAIAGVLNIILKSTSPSELSVTAGQAYTEYGYDGARRQARDGAMRHVGVSTGRAFGEGNFFHVGGEFRDRGATNRSLGDPRPQTFADNTGNVVRTLAGGPVNHRQGDAATTDAVGFLNAGYRFAGGAEFYAFGGVGARQGEAAGFFRRPNDARTVRSLHPNGFLPLIQTDIRDYSLAAGMRGTVGGWRWDASANAGRNQFEFNVANSNNVSLGAASPTDFHAGQLWFAQSLANLDLTREFGGSARPVRVSTGLELRKERYQIRPGEPDSYRDGGVRIIDGPSAGGIAAPGAQVFPGFRPADEVDADRTAGAVYLDLESDLTRAWLVSGAVRYENFSDFGGTTNFKAASRLFVIPQVAVRGSIATGFRAPSLQQNWFSSTATNFIAGVPFDIRTFPVGSPEARLLGAQDLEPETSINASAGFALEPTKALSVTVDVYQITIDDRIVFSENFTGTDIRAQFVAAGFGNIDGGRYFTNAIDTRTRGVDIVVNYGIALATNNVLKLTGGYNGNRTRVTSVIPTPRQLGNRSEALFGRVERARIEEGQPRNTILATALWDLRRLSVSLRTQRFGQVTSRNAPPNFQLDQTFEPKWISDVGLTFKANTRASLTVGADNVFDVYPDRNNTIGNLNGTGATNANFGIFPYNQVSPFGFNGRYVYARVNFLGF